MARMSDDPSRRDPESDPVDPAGALRRRNALLSTLGLLVVVALLAFGFGAYFSPGLMLGIENLRLCF